MQPSTIGPVRGVANRVAERSRHQRRALPLLGAALLVAGCATTTVSASLERSPDPAVPTIPPAPAAPAVPTTTVPPTATTAAPAPPASTATTPVNPRLVAETGFRAFAVVAGVTLHHPAPLVERIGFHESGHDGARQLTALPTAVRPMTLDTRERGTGDRTAADIVVAPGTEVRAPVTGTVTRAGTYTLYCEHRDDFVVIEPDAHPGWEVKVFHIDSVQVRRGQRVEAGVTTMAPRATVLPFESQVDEFTARPAWPHVHVEVVDPTIPDRPSPGGGCS